MDDPSVSGEERYRDAMEEVGRIAHDLNNLLTAVHGYSELASRRLAQDQDPAQELEEVRCAAVRAAELTRRLLALRPGKEQVPPDTSDATGVLADAPTGGAPGPDACAES
jgi:hypothetical protein